jgi:hypothetical protein
MENSKLKKGVNSEYPNLCSRLYDDWPVILKSCRLKIKFTKG